MRLVPIRFRIDAGFYQGDGFFQHFVDQFGHGFAGTDFEIIKPFNQRWADFGTVHDQRQLLFLPAHY